MTAETKVPKEKEAVVCENGLTFSQLKEIMTHMKKEGITHFRMGEGACKLSISRDAVTVRMDSNGGTGDYRNGPCGENAEISVNAEAEEPVFSGHVVTSPVVGVFYDAPAPDQDPYVAVGSYVNKGDVLCIIEAMKLMNEVTSPVSGVVTAILVVKASRVEFGHKLFVIEPGAKQEVEYE